MTNINCTRNCKFQQEGKCCFDSITTPIINFSVISDCPYQTDEKDMAKHEDMQP